MADNTTLNPGAAGDTIATDDIGGVKHQRVKVEFGADGAASDVASGNPLPVDTELTTVDADTGVGTDTRAGVVLVRAESGGGTLVGSAAPLPVNQTAALPAGNNNIGDVDIVTVPAPLSTTGGGTEATALRVTVANNSTGVLPVTDNAGSLTVDAPVGTPAFVRLSDGAAAISALPITDNGGSLTVDGGVTISGTATTTETQVIADNAPFTDGTSKVFPSGYIFDEVAGTALTENDVAAARVNANRAQVSVIEDDTTRGRRTTVTAANALKVDGSAVTQPVSGTVTANADTELPAAAALADTTANPTTTSVGALGLLYNGATWDRVRGDTANGVDVDVTRIAASTVAIGNVGVVPRTTGGYTTFHLVGAATTNATNIKASAGQVFGYYISNRNTTNWAKVAFHNSAGTPTAGAAVFLTVDVPPLSAANVFSETGIAFGTGIAITTVTGAADTDATAVAVNELNINVYYS